LARPSKRSQPIPEIEQAERRQNNALGTLLVITVGVAMADFVAFYLGISSSPDAGCSAFASLACRGAGGASLEPACNKEVRMSRSLRCTLPALVLLTLSCTDAPLGTDAGLDAPAPEFLIGDSPVIVLDRTVPGVEVTVEVTRGLTEVRIEDKFKVRGNVGLWWEALNEPIHLTPVEIDLVGVKDDGVRQGDKVAIIMDIDIPAPEWDALVNADESATGGSNPQLHVLAELIMTDGKGTEHLLDEVDVTVFVDPKGDG
jgi:hypothetical protein